VSWCSILQSIVAFSTTKAEYMAIMEAIKKGIWLQGLLNDLAIYQAKLKINFDSMNVIYLVKNQVYHVRMKHIDVKFLFVRKILEESDLALKKIHIKENRIGACLPK